MNNKCEDCPCNVFLYEGSGPCNIASSDGRTTSCKYYADGVYPDGFPRDAKKFKRIRFNKKTKRYVATDELIKFYEEKDPSFAQHLKDDINKTYEQIKEELCS